MSKGNERKRRRYRLRLHMVMGHEWKKSGFTTVLCCAAWLGATILAVAGYFQYSDAAGTDCITNRVAGVPFGYGEPMQVARKVGIAGRERRYVPVAESFQIAPLPRNNPEVIPLSPASERDGLLPWRKLLGFVAVSIGGLYVVTKAASSFSSPLLARIVYLAFFCGIFLFAYRSDAEPLVTTCISLKEKVSDIFESVDLRQASETGDGK